MSSTRGTAAGWQEVKFATPVAIAANTVYVASYLAPRGGYAFNGGYFTASGWTNAPLYAPRDGESGGNGLYAYAAGNAFPASSFQGGNYWVDVVFSTTAPPDTTAPTVTATSPASGATSVSRTANVTVTFSEAMDATTLNTTTLELRDPGNALVASVVTWDAANRRATLNPNPTLGAVTTYTVVVRGGTADPRVKDVAGNAMAAERRWTFKTR